MIKESAESCYPINDVKSICYDTNSVIIESEKEIDCLIVSDHEVEIFEVKDALIKSSYIDIEIENSTMIRIAQELDGTKACYDITQEPQ